MEGTDGIYRKVIKMWLKWMETEIIVIKNSENEWKLMKIVMENDKNIWKCDEM